MPNELWSIWTYFFLFVELRPSAPQNLRAHAIGSEYIRLDWDNPDQHPGGVLYYKVHYRPLGGSTYTVEKTRDHENTYRLSDLVPNTQYEVYITAKSSHFESPPSNIYLAKSGGKFLRPVYSFT